MNRRSFLQTAGYAALGGAMLAAATPRASAQEREFDINQAFADFMRDIGGSADDAGGTVTFTGKDPILRSHFRIGASMAIPAMAAGVGRRRRFVRREVGRYSLALPVLSLTRRYLRLGGERLCKTPQSLGHVDNEGAASAPWIFEVGAQLDPKVACRTRI